MRRSILSTILAVALLSTLAGCDRVVEDSPRSLVDRAAANYQAYSRGIIPGQANILDVTAKHEEGGHQFELSSHEIASGWTTFRFTNTTHYIHFVYAVRVPDSQAHLSREDYMNAVTFPFQEAWNPYFAGDHDVGTFFENLLDALPDWFGDVIPSGGPGFTSPSERSMVTQYLEPGTYFVECYVMDENGIFHSPLGMLEKLVVTSEDSGAPEPTASLELTISSANGIRFHGQNVRPGVHTVKVVFEDNMVYGNGLKHDAHLIRLDRGTSVSDVNDWMDYLDVGTDGNYADRGALVSGHADVGPQTFLGGVHEIDGMFPQTAYVHVLLNPGAYAWVSEVPDPAGKGLLTTFRIPFGRDTGR